MNKHSFLVLTVVLLGCSEPGAKIVDLETGEAVLTIDNTTYMAEAFLDSRTIADAEYEQITLEVGDSISIGILNENFTEDIVTWAGETFTSAGTRFYFASRIHGGAGFGPTSGYLLISKKTDHTISGMFEIDLYNYASSCSDCFGNEVTVEGQFYALTAGN